MSVILYVQYYVYIFCDPRKPGKYIYPNINICFTYEPFYIGKGSGRRFEKHFHNCKNIQRSNPIKYYKIKHISEFGFNPKEYSFIYQSKLSQSEAFDLEVLLINNIGRLSLKTGPLSNLTDGGGGTFQHISRIRGKTYEEFYGKEKAKEFSANHFLNAPV
jgi:hypothetical protein